MVREVKRTKLYSQEEVENWNCTWSTTNPRFMDLEGKVFGELTILKLHKKEGPSTFWFAECGCGNIISAKTGCLNRGKDRCSYCSLSQYGEGKIIPEKVHLLKIQRLHPNIKLVNSFDGKSKTEWLWYCEKCNTPFKNRIDKFAGKKSPCRCSGRFCKWDEGSRERQILEICKDRGLKFLGWEDHYVNSKSRLYVKCPIHEHYNINVGNFVNDTAKHGCPTCSKVKPTVVKHGLDKLKLKGSLLFNGKFTYDNYEYTCARTPSKVYCTDCEEYFEVSYDNHINKKRGCPYEKGRNQKQGYIFQVKDADIPVALKVGISSNWEDRYRRQSSCSIYDLEVVGVWLFDKVLDCKEWESYVKKSFTRGVLTKEEYSDGFNETYEVTDLEKIIKTYNRFNGVNEI